MIEQLLLALKGGKTGWPDWLTNKYWISCTTSYKCRKPAGTNLLSNCEHEAFLQVFTINCIFHESDKCIDALPFNLWKTRRRKSSKLYPEKSGNRFLGSQVTSCSTPTTAASEHCGCETRADSTSAVPIRCPLHMFQHQFNIKITKNQNFGIKNEKGTSDSCSDLTLMTSSTRPVSQWYPSLSLKTNSKLEIYWWFYS